MRPAGLARFHSSGSCVAESLVKALSDAKVASQRAKIAHPLPNDLQTTSNKREPKQTIDKI
eukprot:1515496-Amphidinium_carterae.2